MAVMFVWMGSTRSTDGLQDCVDCFCLQETPDLAAISASSLKMPHNLRKRHAATLWHTHKLVNHMLPRVLQT
eukprot:scaffold180700_cov19-Tisochrysis_lutea.AAC.1